MIRWFVLMLGAVSIASGLRAIRKRYVYTDVGEYEGDSAARLGGFWIILGCALILAGVFNPPWFLPAIRWYLGD
jgi:hypothetical protein